MILISSSKLARISPALQQKTSARQVIFYLLLFVEAEIESSVSMHINTDPILDNKVLAANLGCSVPYYSSPYFRSGSSKTMSFTYILLFLVPLLALDFLLVRKKEE